MSDEDLTIPWCNLAKLGQLDAYADSTFGSDSSSFEATGEITLPGGSSSVRKSFTFTLQGGRQAFVICDLDDSRLRVTWSGSPLDGGQQLWIAIWDDSSQEPKKWFELGPLAHTESSLDISRQFLGPLIGRKWQVHGVASRE